MEKYAVITQDKEFTKESTLKFKPDTYFVAPEKVSVLPCKCGGKIDTTSNVLLCSKNGSKCFEK